MILRSWLIAISGSPCSCKPPSGSPHYAQWALIYIWAGCHPTLLPPPPRLPQIHLRRRTSLHRLPRRSRHLPLRRRRHPRRARSDPHHQARERSLRLILPSSHRLRLHLPPKHVLHRQRDPRQPPQGNLLRHRLRHWLCMHNLHHRRHHRVPLLRQQCRG